MKSIDIEVIYTKLGHNFLIQKFNLFFNKMLLNNFNLIFHIYTNFFEIHINVKNIIIKIVLLGIKNL